MSVGLPSLLLLLTFGTADPTMMIGIGAAALLMPMPANGALLALNSLQKIAEGK